MIGFPEFKIFEEDFVEFIVVVLSGMGNDMVYMVDPVMTSPLTNDNFRTWFQQLVNTLHNILCYIHTSNYDF